MLTRHVKHVWSRLARLFVLVLAALAPVVVPTPMARAVSPITVDDTSGTVGGSGCTLRDAITAANMDAPAGGCPAGSGDDTIVLPAGATITLTDPDNGTGAEINGLPPITSTITIDGNDAIVERSSAVGTPAFRIFTVRGSLTVNNVTIRNGKTSVGTDGHSGNGGGVQVFGDLTVNNSTISGNSTGNATGDGYPGGGGGISGEYAAARLIVENSTISGNSTGISVSGVGGWGGGISAIRARLIVNNSTISGNTASGTSSSGGGIHARSATTAQDLVISSTITGNTAGTGGGINMVGLPGRVLLFNTIVALNTATSGPNCNGIPSNYGNNIDSGTSCGCGSFAGSMSDTDPLLGSLADNGGPTRTHALLPGSPAIDGVTSDPPNGSSSTDQRGVARPQGNGYDIGAFEFEPPTLSFLPLIIGNP